MLPGDIALMGDNIAAHRLHAIDGFPDALEIAIDREDPGAFFSEAHGDGTTVAPTWADAAGACDDCDPIQQTPGQGCAPVKGRAGAKR